MSADFIPIVGFICVTLVVTFNLVLNHKNRKEVQLTVREMIEKGQDISPEVIEKLGHYKHPRVVDLRRAFILGSLGSAFILSGYLLDEVRLGTAIGVFPLLLGIAFWVNWKFNEYHS